MQLRKVCNHPNLFEVRPVISPFQMEGILYRTASLVTKLLDYDPDRHVNLDFLNLHLADYESMTGLEAYMARKIRAGRRLIEEIDSIEERPRPPKMSLRVTVDDRKHAPAVPLDMVAAKNAARYAGLPAVMVGRSPMMRLPENQGMLGFLCYLNKNTQKKIESSFLLVGLLGFFPILSLGF